MKAILMSIQPKHLVNILNGNKTLELRKNVPKDYKGWVYIYCTKGKKDILYKYKNKYYTQHYLTFTDCIEVLNGKVVARFWFDTISPIDNDVLVTIANETEWTSEETDTNFLLEKMNLSVWDALEYLKGKDGYAWHIKNLEIFDKPKELSEFYKWVRKTIYSGMDCPPYVDDVLAQLTKAPQSWMYVEVEE